MASRLLCCRSLARCDNIAIVMAHGCARTGLRRPGPRIPLLSVRPERNFYTKTVFFAVVRKLIYRFRSPLTFQFTWQSNFDVVESGACIACARAHLKNSNTPSIYKYKSSCDSFSVRAGHRRVIWHLRTFSLVHKLKSNACATRDPPRFESNYPLLLLLLRAVHRRIWVRANERHHFVGRRRPSSPETCGSIWLRPLRVQAETKTIRIER